MRKRTKVLSKKYYYEGIWKYYDDHIYLTTIDIRFYRENDVVKIEFLSGILDGDFREMPIKEYYELQRKEQIIYKTTTLKTFGSTRKSIKM